MPGTHDESKHDSVTSLLARFEKKKSSGPPSPLFTPSPSRGSFARSPSTTSQASDNGTSGWKPTRSPSALTIPRTPSASAPLSSPLEKKASDTSLSGKESISPATTVPSVDEVPSKSVDINVTQPIAEPPTISVTIPNSEPAKEDGSPAILPDVPTAVVTLDDVPVSKQATEDSSAQDSSALDTSPPPEPIEDVIPEPVTATSLVEAIQVQTETEVLAEPVVEVESVVPVIDVASLAAAPAQIAPANVENTSSADELPVADKLAAIAAPVLSNSSSEPVAVPTSSKDTAAPDSPVPEAVADIVVSSTVSTGESATENSQLATSPDGTKSPHAGSTEAVPQPSNMIPVISPEEQESKVVPASSTPVVPSSPPISPSKTSAAQISNSEGSVKATPSAPSTPRKSVVVTRTSISPASPTRLRSPVSPTKSANLAVPSSPSPTSAVSSATTETAPTEAMPIWAQFARNTILFADDAAPLDLGLTLPSPPASPVSADRPSQDVRPSVSSALSEAPTLPKIELDTTASLPPTEAVPVVAADTAPAVTSTPAVPTASDTPVPSASGPARAMTAKRASLLAAKKSLEGGHAELSRRKSKTRSVNPFAALFRAFGKRNKRARRKSSALEVDQQ